MRLVELHGHRNDVQIKRMRIGQTYFFSQPNLFNFQLCVLTPTRRQKTKFSKCWLSSFVHTQAVFNLN